VRHGCCGVASVNDEPLGFVSFSPLKAAGTGEVVASLFAPVAVHPHRQRRGIARSLIARGFEELSRSGPRVVLVYGDPAFYGRFGFAREVARASVPPPTRCRCPRAGRAPCCPAEQPLKRRCPCSVCRRSAMHRRGRPRALYRFAARPDRAAKLMARVGPSLS
jgi:hypothetical protein